MRPLKGIRYPASLIGLSLLLLVTATPVSAQRSPVLVDGDPPLTAHMVGEVNLFCSWLIGRHSEATGAWVKAYLIGNWYAGDEETYEATYAILEAVNLLRQLSPREQQIVRTLVLNDLPRRDAGYLFDGLCSPTPSAEREAYAVAALNTANDAAFKASQVISGNIR